MIRPANPADIPALVHAYDWLFQPPGGMPPQWDVGRAASRLEDAIAAEDAGVLVAERDGEIVGICTIYLDITSVRYGRRAWLEDLAVDPQRRSQGIGKALLDAAKDWARTRGAAYLSLNSAQTRKDAHRFYVREGADTRAENFGWQL